GLISVVAPMAQDMAGMTAESAAVAVGLMGIFNGIGRLLWASLSDIIGRPTTFLLLFLVNMLMTGSLLMFQTPFLFIFA
ncbi:MFS transporter, partial [Psychrobacter sanguinis]|nr:MFS transporter [Psychrobacter sanguinis]